MSLIGFGLLGLVVGTFGTLIGAGGGIFLVPILLILYPPYSSTEITAISLFAIACNATSGSIAYFYRKKIDFKSGLIFATGSIPTAFIGSYLSQFIHRKYFNILFAILMLILGVYLFLKHKGKSMAVESEKLQLTPSQLMLGWIFSLLIGFVASFLGIGGGIIHVPLMIEFLHFPVHIATGTSHFILAITAIIASIQHYVHGDLDLTTSFIWPLAVGVIGGAQIGAFLSKKVKGKVIIRILSVTLILVAIRLLW